MIDTELLRKKIIDLAIQGKLTVHLSEDGDAEQIRRDALEYKRLLDDKGVLKNRKAKKTDEIEADDCPYIIPSTWRWFRLGEISEVFGRIGFRGYTKSDLVDKGQGAISMSPSNISKEGKVCFDNSTYISWEKYEESPEIMLENGDVVLVKTGSSYGKCGIIGDLPEKATINPQLAILKYIRCDRKFLFYALQSSLAWNQYESFVVGAATPTFSQEKLTNLRFPMPPMEEQKRIVELLDSFIGNLECIDKLQKQYESDLDVLKSKIIDAGIRGKLTEQLPEDGDAETLFSQIQDEKTKLIKEGKIKKVKSLPDISDDEIPFEIPENWKWVRFGDLMWNRDSDRVPVSVADRKKLAKIYDYYGASGVIDKVENYLFDEKLLLIGEDGANLISRSTPIAFLADGKYWVNNHAHVLGYYKYDYLDFVMHFINSISLVPYVTGSAQPKLNQENMNKIPVPLPPFAEQKRIVDKIQVLLSIVE